MKYLREFIIGSSFPVVVLFYRSVYSNIQKKRITDPGYFETLPDKDIPFLWDKIWPSNYEYYSYFRYTITAPIYFGLWNILSLIIANHFGLSLRMRFIVIGILSSLFMMIFQTIYNIYNFKTKDEFEKYYLHIFIKYMFVWNIVIYALEIYI
tara:strand:+ start:874 stop:1329 length:456 start_codon:yes stop_codon:yes gene_type:complete